ncbi:WD40 repeat-like protein, partial [Rhizopogon salebrosus TDB-379]
IALSPNGKTVAAGCSSGIVRLWDIETKRVVTEWTGDIGHTNGVNASAFFYDGRRIVTGSGDKTLQVWAAQKGTLLGEPFEAHQGSVLSNAYSP